MQTHEYAIVHTSTPSEYKSSHSYIHPHNETGWQCSSAVTTVDLLEQKQYIVITLIEDLLFRQVPLHT